MRILLAFLALLIASPIAAQTRYLPPAAEGPANWSITTYRDYAWLDGQDGQIGDTRAARVEMLRQAEKYMSPAQFTAWSKATSLSVNSTVRYMEWFLKIDPQTHIRVVYQNHARDLGN